MSKMNPNAKAFTPKNSPVNAMPKGQGASNTNTVKPIPKAPPVPVKSNTLSSSDAGKILDSHDARTATNKSPAHNRSLHVGMSDNALASRNKPIATSYLSKADQNKAAAALLNSAKGQNKVSDLANDSDGKTRAIQGSHPTGPGKPGATWNKTASITRVVEKTPTGTVAYNAKATENKMELAKTGGNVNVQSTYAVKPKGGFTPLEKPATGPKVPAPKLGFDQKDYSSVTKNVPKPANTAAPKSPVNAPKGPVNTAKPAPKPSYADALNKKK